MVLKTIHVINPENNRNLNKLVLSLNHKLSPAVYFISCNTEKLRKNLYESITSGSPRYKHVRIDLTPHSVYSLRDAINKFVPDEVHKSAALTYVVHFTGISSSLFTSEGGTFKKSMLLEELNFEREIIFQDYPFISVLWMNPFFFKELFWKAGDLMSWAFDRYEFTDGSPEGVTHEIPYNEPLQKQGAIPERTERIKELEDLLHRLDEEDQDQQKVMVQKINALLLLGRENMTAFRWKEAEEYLLKAKYFADKGTANTIHQAEVFFYLGKLYISLRNFNKALYHYEKALEICKTINEDSIAAIYHQIGMVYAAQRNWQKALTIYQEAIKWKYKTGNEYNVGNTYHQIGRVYQEQQLWEEALTNYYQAAKWLEKTGNEYELGSTFHQIGIVFQQQRRWEVALINFQKAIESYKKTGNEYELGSTYYQVARVYEEQQRWEEALINYQEAIESDEKTGNRYALGHTYSQIGNVYQDQANGKRAITYYQKAIEWYKKTGNEYELGSTYHQIGIVCEKQRQYEEALINYKKAVEWYGKTRNEYELGGSYHQIARVYEEQGIFQKAKEYFEMAVEKLKEFNHSFLPVAEQSLQRIQTKLASLSKDN